MNDEIYYEEENYDDGVDHNEFFGFQIIRNNIWSTYFGPHWRAEQTDDKGIVLIRGLYGKSGRLLECFKLLVSGCGNRETSRIVGFSKNTVIKHRLILEKILGYKLSCPCGKSATHQGWCSFRFSKSNKRQEFMRNWHIKN